jgi:hypothetical protein
VLSSRGDPPTPYQGEKGEVLLSISYNFKKNNIYRGGIFIHLFHCFTHHTINGKGESLAYINEFTLQVYQFYID